MRLEFSRATRREALRRSGKICEAIGLEFGYQPGQRCVSDLSLGCEFHHATPAEMGGDNGLGNCLAICIKCHRYTTRSFIKELRHSDRVRDRNDGTLKPSAYPLAGSRRSQFKRKLPSRNHPFGETVRR